MESFPLSVSIENSSCQRCPREVVCDSNTLDALPNYWGQKDNIGKITMMRCPDQYCCQRSDDCKGISTCNTGRGGTLCGRCVGNTTESLFSANCFQVDKCYTLLFGFLYAACVVMYSTFLAIYDDVKKEFIKRALKLFKKIKNKRKSREMEQNDDNMIYNVNKTDSYSSLVKALLLADNTGNSQLQTLKAFDKKGIDTFRTSKLVETLLLPNFYHLRKLSFLKKISTGIKDEIKNKAENDKGTLKVE